jgi:hypothetical protein
MNPSAWRLVISVVCWISLANARADITNGLYRCEGLYVGPDQTFNQYGGTMLVANNVVLQGDYGPRFTTRGAYYYLRDGVLSCADVRVSVGTFFQTGGTNEVSGSLLLQRHTAPASYDFNGGVLTASNVTVQPGCMFRHRSGQLVTRDLYLVGDQNHPNRWPYTLSGGELVVSRFVLSNQVVFRHTGGTLRQQGRFILGMGHFEANVGEHSFGPLVLLAGHGFASSLLFPTGATTLRFRESSHLAWNGSSILWVLQWAGSTNGAGQHQLFFGTNGSGLTSAQLAQVRFIDPAGLPPGAYPAALRANGEIVPVPQLPARGPTILVHADARRSYINREWPPGYVMQSATNILGPFRDDYSSPPFHADYISEYSPIRFYRLRHSSTAP